MKTVLGWGLLIAVILAACSSGETTTLGGDVADLESALHSDPRYQSSRVVVELRNDASGSLIEWVEIIMPDSNCPTPTAEACAGVINTGVRLLLSAPSIGGHPGIMVTLESFLPVRDNQGRVIREGQPPLAEHSLAEWRDLLGAP